MSHILTAHGRQHSFASAGPQADAPGNVPALREICHSLAQINRFTGHARRPYSVAEHSLLVARIAADLFDADPLLQLLCLMHDAHECVTGDVATPIKYELGLAWHKFEAREQTRLLHAYGLLDAWLSAKAAVKRCDLIALATERRDLLPWEPLHHAPWPVLDTPGQVVRPWGGCDLTAVSPDAIDWNRQKWDLIDALEATALKARHSLPGLVDLLPAQGMPRAPMVPVYSEPMDGVPSHLLRPEASP